MLVLVSHFIFGYCSYDDCGCCSLDKTLDSMNETLNSVDGVSNNNDTFNKDDQVHENDIAELSKPNTESD